MQQQNRKFSRVPFRVEATLATGDAVYSPTAISNLGVGGCLLDVQGDFPVGASCELTIELAAAETPTRVLVSGEIVRFDEKGLAVKFTGTDPDSLYHLKNIVRYNNPDPEAVEQEFLKHPGLF